MRSAAFFDLDKTLIARSPVLAFAVPLHRAQLLTRRDVTRSLRAQRSFVSSRADHALMEQIRVRLSTVIAGWSTDTLREVIDAHLETILRPFVYAEAAELIERHRAAGDVIVLVTSTGTEVAHPVGLLFGAEHVLATRMEHAGGHYTGRIADFMYGPRKAVAIAELAQREGIDLGLSHAYSDSVTDLPLLEAVGRPTAVNPDRELRRVAADRGWPVLDFRDAPVLRRRARTKLILAGMLLATGLAGVAVGVGLGVRRTKMPSRAGAGSG